jgi:Beta-propeller repeat
MRFVFVLLLAAFVAAGIGCGGKFELPTERRIATPVPTDQSYAMLATWKGFTGISDVIMTRDTGAQLFMLFNSGGSGGPATPRGVVRLYPFTQPNPIGAPFFEDLRTLFNPIAIAAAQSKLFVLDEGDSCMAKYDPIRNTCEADTVRNGSRNMIFDYTATWRVREYPISGGDTVSTFTDTTFAWVNGIAADDLGNIYVSGTAVVLDTNAVDPRIRTRKYVSRIYRYARGPKYPGVVPNDLYMPGANWHRDTTWLVLDGTGASSIIDPRGMRWTPVAGGGLLVADRGNNKVKLIGTYAPRVGISQMDGSETPTGSSFDHPTNVAVDGSGYLYVVDRGNRRVLRYTTYGAYVQDVNVEPNSDGLDLDDPVAVGVDDSVAYIADQGRSQVIRYKRRK